jgi:hypothetical protein
LTGPIEHACFAVRRGRRGYVDLAGEDRRRYAPEGQTSEQLLTQLFLEAHGDELAEGTVSFNPSDETAEIRISQHSTPAIVKGPKHFWSARKIVGDLRKGNEELRLDPKSISAFGWGGAERGWWTAYFGVEQPTEAQGDFWTEWSYGFPIERTLTVLAALTAEGWRIARVSEDRGLYEGDDAQTDSSVTTTRHWLVRNG